MSFLLYMASQQRAYNILQGEIPSTIDISNTFTISLDGTTLVSTFTAGTTITPQGFVDKLNSDLNLGNDLTLGEDSYVSVEKLKELYPGLEVLDVSNRIHSMDASSVQVNETLDSINTKLSSIIEYIANRPRVTIFTHTNGSKNELLITDVSNGSYTDNSIDNTDINSVRIGTIVTDICDNCFKDCINLSSVTFDAREFKKSTYTYVDSTSELASIGSYAFQNSGLISFDIPNTVISIASSAFSDCSSLTSVSFESGSQLASIGENAFRDTSLNTITIPASVTSIASSAFSGCSSLTSLLIESGSQLTSIGDNAFSDTSLTTITIPASVTTIASSAFSDCSSLTSVSFESGSQVTSIESYAFQKSGLISFDIPNTVTSIASSAFTGCSSLTSVNFESGSQVTFIGDNAFSDTRLNTITIPVSVTTIASSAFSGCSSLTSVNFESGSQVTFIGDSAFSDTRLNTITIPASVTTIASSAFYGCSSLTSVTFETGSQLESIEYNTFRDSNINTITIPSTVTSISGEAFGACSNLTSMLVPSGITYGSNTFQDTTDLSNVFFYNKENNTFYNGVKTDNSITQGTTQIIGNSSPTLDEMAAHFGSDAATGRTYIENLGYTFTQSSHIAYTLYNQSLTVISLPHRSGEVFRANEEPEPGHSQGSYNGTTQTVTIYDGSADISLNAYCFHCYFNPPVNLSSFSFSSSKGHRYTYINQWAMHAKPFDENTFHSITSGTGTSRTFTDTRYFSDVVFSVTHLVIDQQKAQALRLDSLNFYGWQKKN